MFGLVVALPHTDMHNKREKSRISRRYAPTHVFNEDVRKTKVLGLLYGDSEPYTQQRGSQVCCFNIKCIGHHFLLCAGSAVRFSHYCRGTQIQVHQTYLTQSESNSNTGLSITPKACN